MPVRLSSRRYVNDLHVARAHEFAFQGQDVSTQEEAEAPDGQRQQRALGPLPLPTTGRGAQAGDVIGLFAQQRYDVQEPRRATLAAQVYTELPREGVLPMCSACLGKTRLQSTPYTQCVGSTRDKHH